MTDLNSFKVAPLTMIFLIDGDKVLTLKRNKDKKIYPSKISGFGGKVEPGEDLEVSARRELQEEAGITVNEMSLRGTFIRVLEDGYINEMYIFVARGFTGKPFEMSDEGKVEWRSFENFLSNPETVDHIPLYFEQVTAGVDFYCGIAEYSKGERKSYADSTSHFDARRQA